MEDGRTMQGRVDRSWWVSHVWLARGVLPITPRTRRLPQFPQATSSGPLVATASVRSVLSSARLHNSRSNSLLC